MGPEPSPRDSHVLVTSNHSIFLFGGSSGNPRNDFFEYMINENKWIPHNEGNRPTSRFCHVGVVLKKRFYVFGGYDGENRLNDFHYFIIEDDDGIIPESNFVSDMVNYLTDDSE